MKCPECGANTKTIDSRQRGRKRMRRRECPDGHRSTTWELLESDYLKLRTGDSDADIIRAVAQALPDFIDLITANLAKNKESDNV